MYEGRKKDKHDCNRDKGDNCGDIKGHECYKEKVREECCYTCEEIHSDTPDCEYGDRRTDCEGTLKAGLLCYNSTINHECCHSCQEYDTEIQGCKYGDKLVGCQRNECESYAAEGRERCCYTCSGADKSYSSTAKPRPTIVTAKPSTDTIPSARTSTVISSTTMTLLNKSNLLSGNAGNGAWVLPVTATLGGLVLVVIVTLVYLIVRRHRKSTETVGDKHLKRYRSSVSQRAPMVLPRPPSLGRDWVQERKPSAEYAYINPEHVGDFCNNRPLPPTPDAIPEYLDLEDTSTYSYADTNDVMMHASIRDNDNTGIDPYKKDKEIYRSDSYRNSVTKMGNTYEVFPTAPRLADMSPATDSTSIFSVDTKF